MTKENSNYDSGNDLNLEVAVLAGGCFWGVQELINDLEGVVTSEVGYTGGHLENPTYEDICRGDTGHAEAIKIEFDPKLLSFDKLLDFFFTMHDPTTVNQQGNDRGTQYRSAIFYTNEAQNSAAQKAIQRAQTSGLWKSPVVTELVPASEFFSAEGFHQDYLKKNPGGYSCHYIRG